MQITIACVGKLKETYWQKGYEEFVKRLQPFCKLELVYIMEEKMPEGASPKAEAQVLAKETKRLLEIIPSQSYVILLDVKGKEMSSPDVAAKLQDLMVAGKSHLTFVIGGPFGYTDELRQRADYAWSFSKLTFTHQMIRVLLVEQIYRAFKIMHNQKYHH